MKKTLALFSILAILSVTSGCGQFVRLIISDFDFQTVQDDGQQLLNTSFALSLGEVSLPVAEYPLPDDLGTFRLFTEDGVNRVGVSLNLTKVINLPTEDAKLPNGSALPIDTQGANVFQIPISGIVGNVYLAVSGDVTLVGFAFSVSQLDSVGDSLGNFGVFPNFNVGNINITAGIFSSADIGQTGVAAFANLGSILESGPKPVQATQAKVFAPVETTVSKKQAIYLKRELTKFKNTKQVLELVKE